MKKSKERALLLWSLTPWAMNGHGGWKTQPVIVVEGRKPFFADTPQEYIAELERLHDDEGIARGNFYTLIGQLKDAFETGWNPGLFSLPKYVVKQEVGNGSQGPHPK